jgi:predicted DCC family thiol-disulfide oxidoreductase YuxK
MNVIFFDGHCGLCNGFVDFMMKIDRGALFKFSPLQSDFAKKNLPPEDVEDLKSVVVLINGKTYRKAKGVLMAMTELGGFWKFLGIFKLFPSVCLNFFYDIIAENRYQFFGKRDTCRLPTLEEKARFIL